MSLHGLTKGTEVENIINTMMQAEANGTVMYYALAQLAKEQGLDDAAEVFITAANQEAVHAGFYSVLNGKYPQDFWGLVRAVQKVETNGEAQVQKMADKMRSIGFSEAAEQMEIFAKEEGRHGVVLAELLKKYQPNIPTHEGEKVYLCSVCGYEYIGDINKEDNNYVCPICGQPKSVFK